MERFGIKSVAISSLNLPGDMPKRQKSEGVIEMAKSLGEVGLLERPMVRKSDLRVISGRDRIAAHMVAGLPEVEVELVECSDHEAAKIDTVSNLYRRADGDERKRLVIRLTELYEAEEAAKPPPAYHDGPGRPRNPHGIAVDRVAAEVGVKPGTVRQIKRREEIKRQERAVPKPKPTIKTYGMPVGDDFLAQCKIITAGLRTASRNLSSAQHALDGLLNSEIPISNNIRNLRAEVNRLYGEAKKAPYSLCPYCKGVEEFQDDCTFCLGDGWVARSEMDGVPRDLLLEGDEAIIMSGGEVFPVTDVVDMDGAEWVD